MEMAIPLYKVPGRKSITDKMENKYDLLSTSITLKLKNLEAVTLTADIGLLQLMNVGVYVQVGMNA